MRSATRRDQAGKQRSTTGGTPSQQAKKAQFLARHFLAGATFWKLYVPPNFLLKRSTRPAVSTNFCLPVKNGWHWLQISTLIFGSVLRVTNELPQAQ
jgi:hypothetical protein